jgi:hypothetical protein
MNQIENKPDTAAMLSTLAGIIREFHVPVDQYLRDISEPMQGGFWERLGIRRVTWDPIRIIEFADWAAVDNASGVWDGLYSDVIKPLKKRDFQFIFHLGDVAKKPVFETDEVLDIICDYASYGKVTLILDEHEADNLWCRLNGRNPDDTFSGVGSPGAKERYLSLFNTMRVDVLLVLCGGCAMLFSREGQFDLTGKSPVSIREVIHARDRFSAGYQMGLLLRLETLHCIALGLAVAGGCPELSSGSGSAAVLAYLEDWISGI